MNEVECIIVLPVVVWSVDVEEITFRVSMAYSARSPFLGRMHLRAPLKR